MSFHRLHLLVPVLLFAAGCQLPDRSTHEPQSAIVSGIIIHGAPADWDSAKIETLQSAAAAIDKTYPVISIRFTDASTAEVTTGIVRAPLDGAGFTYVFSLKGGRWTLVRPPGLPWIS